jgi:molybdopterin/thiamine biosynthesis adenylyltransferase
MKIDKYDRQLRIWGPKGQKALAEASVAIIGCSGPSI